MKLKTIAAILFSAAALTVIPSVPPLRNVVQDISITAEAADTVVGYSTISKVRYTLYSASNGVLHAEVTGSDSDIQSASVKASISYGGNSYPVTQVAAGAFQNRRSLGTADLTGASSLTKICTNAFSGSSVQTVKISSYMNVEGSAFSGCTSLTSVTFSGSSYNVSVQRNAFKDCSALRNVTFSCGTVSIYESGFGGCQNLESIVFGSSLRSVWLASKAISDLPKLSTVRFDNSSVSLTMFSYAFAGTAIRSITLPTTVTTLPAYCFADCKNLTGFTIPSHVKQINAYAFKGAKLSSTFTIPKTVTTVYESSFYGVEGVAKYSVPSGHSCLKVSDDVLYSKNGTLYSYPPMKTNSSYTITATAIADGSIANNPYLQSLSLPNYVRRDKDKSAFYNLSALKSITLPSAEFNRSGAEIMTRFDSLFGQNSQLIKINGINLVQYPQNDYPAIHSKFKEYMREAGYLYENRNCRFLADFVNSTTSYIVNSVTKPSMSQLQKAVLLHEWICKRTTYDPKAKGANPVIDPNNFTWSSVYLHEERNYAAFGDNDFHFVTVCQGYSRCYSLLMNEAGIETHYVTAGYRDQNGAEQRHGWNLVMLNNKWYHVDVTWDDEFYDSKDPGLKLYRYYYFLCPDGAINNASDAHSPYYWVSLNNKSLNKNTSVATDCSYYALGDVDAANSSSGNGYTSSDLALFNLFANGSATPSAWQKARGDLNFDGVVDSKDRNLFSNYLNLSPPSNYRPGMWIFINMEQ